MWGENRFEWEKLQALTQSLSPQVIPFSIPRIEYAMNLNTSSGFADAGATLLEKLYVCWDSDVEHGGNGVGEGNCGPRQMGCQ